MGLRPKSGRQTAKEGRTLCSGLECAIFLPPCLFLLMPEARRFLPAEEPSSRPAGPGGAHPPDRGRARQRERLRRARPNRGRVQKWSRRIGFRSCTTEDGGEHVPARRLAEIRIGKEKLCLRGTLPAVVPRRSAGLVVVPQRPPRISGSALTRARKLCTK